MVGYTKILEETRSMSKLIDNGQRSNEEVPLQVHSPVSKGDL